MKKVIVTGAAGMVGQNLVPLLIKNQYRVIAIDKNLNNLNLLKQLNKKVEIIHADLSEKGSWVDSCKKSFAIIDLKAQIASKDPKQFHKNNVKVEKHIIEACKIHKIPHLIHASSSVVISVGKDKYTKTKRTCENIVHNSGVPHTILRPTLMYGCFDVKHLGWIASMMKKSFVMPIPGSGEFIRQPLYALDFCRIILSCLNKIPKNQIHNIIGFEKIDFIDLLKTIAKVNKIKVIIFPLPLTLFKILLRMYSLILRKPTVTPDQLTALMGGDEFPVEDWTAEFDVKYTPFNKAIKQIYKSHFYKYSKYMNTPH